MKSICPSEIRGTVYAPPSKSMTVRAIAAASLSRGRVEVVHPSYCEDAVSALRIIEAMGSKTEKKEEALFITPGPVRSATGPRLTLDCGESGLCMRMFAPIAALSGGDTVLAASGSLRERPMEMVEGLRARGVRTSSTDGHAPVSITGPLTGGPVEVDAAVTSQFLSGLLMALPLCAADSTITVTNLASAPYVHMTVALLRSFGIVIEHDAELRSFAIQGGQEYMPTSYTVEGDWSAGAFLLVAGAVAGSVLVEGLSQDSLQADRAIIGALAEAGAMTATSADSVYVQQNTLKPFVFDATDCPDLFPPLVALASRCGGTSVVHGAHRLTHKESNRALALATEFNKMGIPIHISGDTMTITGGPAKGAHVDSHKDHRIAMACAVAALGAEGPTTIGGSESVSKSYPAFFRDLAGLQVTP
jgi:3-phosphoshikimate 1-carboxyvinyltransferase